MCMYSACMCMSCVCTCMCLRMQMCSALLVFKSQYLGVHNFYFSLTQILFFYLLNLGFVVAIISSIKSGPK